MMFSLANPAQALSVPHSVVQSPEKDPRTTDTSMYLDRLREYSFESLRYLRNAQVKALDSDFALLGRQLDQLSGLQTGWDGYSAPKPTNSTLSDAREILRKLQNELIKPQKISASAEGGVAFSFRASGDRRAQIEVLNGGEKYAHLYDLHGNSYTHEWPTNYQDEPIGALLEALLNYMQS